MNKYCLHIFQQEQFYIKQFIINIIAMQSEIKLK
ncbi:hypothetical protein pb186bvf_018065 [Paramecium bursaria]